MKAKYLCLTLLLMLTALCALSPRLLATEEGDWTPTNIAQWWWKFVRTANDPNRIDVSRVDVVLTHSAKAGYDAHQVTFTLTNTSSTTYKGGESYRLEYQYAEGDPQPWRPAVIGKGLTPSIGAGRSAQISAIAYTPTNSKYNNFVALTVGQ